MYSKSKAKVINMDVKDQGQKVKEIKFSMLNRKVDIFN